MEASKKPRTTAEVSLKDSLNNWQDLIYRHEKSRRDIDHRFWEESWNEE